MYAASYYGIPEHIRENEAIQNGKAIIGRLLHELGQIEGLFSDDDGNIAAAMSDAEAFIYPPCPTSVFSLSEKTVPLD